MNDDEDQDGAEICDRRLSRAARSILEELLRQIVFSGDTEVNDSDDIWTLLEHWLRDARPAECHLFPSRDVLRYDEEQSIPIKPPSNLKGSYPNLTLKERRKQNSKRPTRWYKCGMCAKVFLSRYYMDLHLKTHHNPDHQAAPPSMEGDSSFSAIDPMLVCPAHEWCKMLGEANCHEQALREEPFYDRGSGGWSSDDSQFIQHRYSKLAHSIPCDVEDVRAQCQHVLDSCRLPDTSLCENLSCPSFHNYFGQQGGTSSSSSMIPDDWRSIWMYETQHHHSGTIVGIFLCLVICAWVYYMTMVAPFATTQQSKSRNSLGHPAGKRSPQKPPREATTTITATTPWSRDAELTHRRHQFSNVRRFE